MVRKRKGKFVVLNDDPVVSLSTLADLTVKEASGLTLVQGVYVNSVDIIPALRDLTPGEGPIVVTLSDGPLTVTEIKECLEANPLFQGDVPATEHAKRRVRIVGQFSGELASEIMNDGKFIRVPIRWHCPPAGSLPVLGAYNKSGGTLTTGAEVSAQIKYYCNWDQ